MEETSKYMEWELTLNCSGRKILYSLNEISNSESIRGPSMGSCSERIFYR